MPEVPLIPVNIASICIESFLYGIFSVLSVSSIYLLVHRHRVTVKRPFGVKKIESTIFRSPMFYGAVLLLLNVTTHWGLNVTRLFQAFVHYNGGTNPLGFYSDLSQTSEVVKTAFVVSSLVIGDTMIIYRVWIVWDYSKQAIAFPMSTLTGLAVCGTGITYQLTRYSPGQNVFLSQSDRWITSLCVLTLCTNVYSTVMIGWRVWRTNRVARNFGGQSLTPVLATFVESAALYTSWTIFFITSYQSHSNLQYVAVDSMPSMSGIAFMLINVRVGLGLAQKANQQSTTMVSTMAFRNTFAPENNAGEQNQPLQDGSYALQPLAVNITRVVKNDGDSAPTGILKSTDSESISEAKIQSV